MWLNGYFYVGSPLYFQRHPICCCLSNCSEKEDQFDNEKDQNEAEENEDVNGEERGENEEEEENTEDINEEDDDEEDRLSGEVSKIKSCYIHTIYTSILTLFSALDKIIKISKYKPQIMINLSVVFSQ